MSLHAIDWIIIAVYMLGCIAAGVWMRRYIRSVDDFAVAGREMDLNLGIASLAATEVGIVTVMYAAEYGFKYGLGGAVPGVMGCLAMFLVGCTGFVIVPMRNAGVMTIPELFEKRFGAHVRWLAGLVIILGGVLNMGIFLRMGGDFLMYVTGFDPHGGFLVYLPGFEFRLGYLELLMTALLATVLLYTVLGGMISVLVTDYLQFLVMGLGLVVTSVLVVWSVGWWNLINGLTDAHQAAVAIKQTGGAVDPQVLTMGEPFNVFSSDALGWRCVLWQAISQIAVMTTWQTTIARVLAARNAQTAKRIYRRTAFYFVGRFGLPGLWGAAALLYFRSHGGLPEGVGSLTAMPVYLATLLPTGLLGIMIAAMLAAEMSTDSGYLLTWATVIYNDLIGPCLRRPMAARTKLLTVRLLVLAIGLFLVFYGLWYEMPGAAWDYLLVTADIYLASVFTLLVGALYWRGANSWGAIAAIVLGAVGPLAFLVLNAVVPKDSWWRLTAEAAGLSAFVLAFGGMIVGSLVARAFGRGRCGPIPGKTETVEVEQ